VWPWDGFHAGWMGWWMGLWMVFWLAVLLLLVWIVARAAGGSGQAWRADETPEQILKRRYARGEVEREEYERRLTDLRK
jgi:putative membrane protein